MKTQVENFRQKQAKNNRIMFILFMISGALLFIVSGFMRFDTDRVNQAKNIAGIEATFNNTNMKVVLEVDKLHQLVAERQDQVYRLALNNLAEVEEPELLFTDIADITAAQQKYFNEPVRVEYRVMPNTYLIDLYEKKNEEVFRQIETERHFKEMLTAENEKTMNVETWMVEDDVWSFIKESNRDFDKFLTAMYEEKNKEVYEAIEKAAYWSDILAQETDPELDLESLPIDNISTSVAETGISPNLYLQGLVAAKNEAVFNAISLQCKCREYLAVAIEEPLELEDWMVNEGCWCPNKKQGEYLFNESYAMKTEKNK